MSSSDALHAEIKQQTELLNKLRLQNTDPHGLEAAKKSLGELKRALGAITGSAGGTHDTGSSEGKDTAKRRERILLKTAKVGLSPCHLLRAGSAKRRSLVRRLLDV